MLPALSRKAQFDARIVIIDGLPGCGKTMLSPIVSALERVEKLTFAFEIEHVCQLRDLGRLDDETARVMVRIYADMKLYYMMMGRDVNFRWKDLSSAWMDSQPWRYVRRLFGPGDEAVPEMVRTQRPILHLTTHQLLCMGRPVLEALEDRVLLVDVVRHPLYMVKQQAHNMERLIGDVRYPGIHFEHKGCEVPFWGKTWEEAFIVSNAVEKAARSIIYLYYRAENNKTQFPDRLKKCILTVPFEDYVLNPDPYMKVLTEKLNTRITPLTLRVMKHQRVPRKKIADGINLSVYKRYGWRPSRRGSTEEDELADRRAWLAERVSPDILKDFDRLCRDYERTYMGGEKKIPDRS